MELCVITTWGGEDYRNRRNSVGLFESREKACEALELNLGDLNEAGWYPFAIIEELEFGLYPDSILVAVYIYDREEGEWRKCPTTPPAIIKCLEKYNGFSTIG
ncbi:MAG: hypothetical protein ACXAC5_01345 [Promethearchaeota archaeon]|jgi:hypothetical protein